MTGGRYVPPVPTEAAAPFVSERKGAEVHYSRRDDAGRGAAPAFVDDGKRLEVREWMQNETVLAALRVAASKWESITIDGAEKYKEAVVQLAAEHGFRITNPDLRDRIEQARAQIEAQRPIANEEKPPVEAKGPPTAEERQRRLDLENLEREKLRELQRQIEKPRHRE